MVVKEKSAPPDLHFAFDVGHSSIGWAVLRNEGRQNPHLLGCGTVIFPADDCLAAKRRQFRRQRRHIRSTRQRIARLKRYFQSLGALTERQLDQVASSSPWFLAARVLRGGPLLTWPELWDVLRWYAHNRGYDGNRSWSHSPEELAAEKEDTEKVEKAKSLLSEFEKAYGRPGSMAEVWCHLSGLDPLGPKRSAALEGNKRPKAQNAAFPRAQVCAEVRAVLTAHVGMLPAIDEACMATIMDDWAVGGDYGVTLPARYHGGLLFGQLHPRFDNRIIDRCPFEYQRLMDRAAEERLSAAQASRLERDLQRARGADPDASEHQLFDRAVVAFASALSKVPAAACPEFFRFRWAMQVANVRIATSAKGTTKGLTSQQRQSLRAMAEEQGAFTKAEFKRAVRALTGSQSDNLDELLSLADADRALVYDPARKVMQDRAFADYLACLSGPRLRKLWGQLWRGKSISLGELRAELDDPSAFDAVREREMSAVGSRRKKGAAQPTVGEILARRLQLPPMSGRAPHSREIMRDAFDFVMKSDRHPAEGSEGAFENGPLFRSEAVRQARVRRAIAEQTNNHLVRHRLLILERLQADLLQEYAGGNCDRVAGLVVEVNREVKDYSGKTAKEAAQEENARLRNFQSVVRKLDPLLPGGPPANFASLVRKARIADDLGCTCPYTGRTYDLQSVIAGEMALDHIVPYSVRPSNSLDSLVVTLPNVNEAKGSMTGLEFIQWANLDKNEEMRDRLGVWSESRYQQFVEGLDTRGHDDDRRRKRNRKRLLLLQTYVEKEFTPGDLTRTSQLVRLGAAVLEKPYRDREKPIVALSLPGAITGLVRKSWRLLGCLSAANPNVIDSATGEVFREKQAIRGITHLHHALDACVLAFASRLLPGHGRNEIANRYLAARGLGPEDQQKARKLFGEQIVFTAQGNPYLQDLPVEWKEQIRQALAERRVVQHLPVDMSGMRAEQNAWRVAGIETDGKLLLHQRIRQPDGSRPLKVQKENPAKLVGLVKGKLQELKAALVIADNYGLALDPVPTIIPFHKVWVRLRELRQANGGRPVRVLRNGMIIEVPSGNFAGVWRIFSLKNNASGIALDMGRPDVVRLQNKTEGHKINVKLASLLKAGMHPLGGELSGVASRLQQ